MAEVVGLIPARAGTTLVIRDNPLRFGAHPRSRGDHFVEGFRKPKGQGSSPLARGPPSFPVVFSRSMGLIPARAGTTFLSLGFY